MTGSGFSAGPAFRAAYSNVEIHFFRTLSEEGEEKGVGGVGRAEVAAQLMGPHSLFRLGPDVPRPAAVAGPPREGLERELAKLLLLRVRGRAAGRGAAAQKRKILRDTATVPASPHRSMRNQHNCIVPLGFSGADLYAASSV